MPKFIASADHVSAYPEPVEFKPGEELQTGEMDSEYSGWIRVKTADDREGWAPVQYLDFSSEKGQALANTGYTARELTVAGGEELYLVRELNAWGWFEKANSEPGWVPMNKVMPETDV